jgi:MFS family permease
MNEQPTKEARWSLLPRNVWVVTVTSFLTDVSSEMLISLVPQFLNEILGATTSVIGLIEGIAESTASLLKMGSGWLSDRLGRRKGLAVAGYALSTLAKPFLIWARSWPAVLAVRFADRVGKGVRTAPRDALVADSVEPARRGLAFGIHRAGDTAGAVVGILLALLVLKIVQGDTTRLSLSGFRALVALSIIPAALAVVALAIGAKEIVGSRTERASRPVRTALSRRFKAFLIVVVIFTLGNSSDAFLVLRARAAGLSMSGVLGMMLTFNVIYAAIAGPAGALSDRIDRRHLIVGGWLVYGLIYLGFAYVTAGWQAWLLMSIYGAYYGLTDGVAKAFVADLVPAESRGTAYGLYNAAVGLAALPASVLAGVLWQGLGTWQGWGSQAPFLFGAAMAMIASVLIALLRPTSAVRGAS